MMTVTGTDGSLIAVEYHPWSWIRNWAKDRAADADEREQKAGAADV
jgi:hypothetical protein